MVNQPTRQAANLVALQPAISTGFSTLDAMTGIGGYPKNRLTHIHGPSDRLRKLVRAWGPTVWLLTPDALRTFKLTRKPERLVVDATAIQSVEQWLGFERVYDQIRSLPALPSTLVWLTEGDPKMVPLSLKYSAYLRLMCDGGVIAVAKNLGSAGRDFVSWQALFLDSALPT